MKYETGTPIVFSFKWCEKLSLIRKINPTTNFTQFVMLIGCAHTHFIECSQFFYLKGVKSGQI